MAVADRSQLRLRQLRVPHDDLLGEAITEAFGQGRRSGIRERGFAPVNYSMQLAIHHSTGTHVWTRSSVIPLTVWIENNQRSREWLDKLAKQLNSAQDFDATGREFFAEMAFFKNGERGGGRKGKKHNPGRMSYEKLLKQKKCIIQIKNKDELCCARAIVTLKARVDNDVQYKHLRLGRGLQGFLAKQMHQEAGVVEGPCGHEELKKFQEYLGVECQLIVLEGLKGKILCKDKQYDRAPNVIALLKTPNHYHSVTSIPAPLNRSYFCRHCEKGYSNENRANHNCMGQNCSACRRGNKTCPNFATWLTPEVCCERCNVKFYGLNVLRRTCKNSVVRKVYVNGLESVWDVVRCMRLKARRNMCVINTSVAAVEKSQMSIMTVTFSLLQKTKNKTKQKRKKQKAMKTQTVKNKAVALPN